MSTPRPTPETDAAWETYNRIACRLHRVAHNKMRALELERDEAREQAAALRMEMGRIKRELSEGRPAMKTIEQFCSDHRACPKGQEWALAHCKDMLEVWRTAKPTWLIWIATRPGVLTERELRLFAVWCARQVQHLLTDPRSIKAIDVAERYANGEATEEELEEAQDAAWHAAREAKRSAAWAAVDVSSAATTLALAAVMTADWAPDKTKQAEWLRNNTQPNFS